MNEKQYISEMLDRTMLCFDKDSIEKIRNTVFAIAGLGGVGAITAELVARWGVKRFRLLDMDHYESSNLNRQLFAISKTLGRSKVEVAAERIMEINPYAKIEMAIHAKVDNENVQRFVKGAGIIIQNSDTPSHQLFNSAAREHRVPLIKGYANIFALHLVTFDYRSSTCMSNLEKWWNRFKFGNAKQLAEMKQEEIAEFDAKYISPTSPSINYVTNLYGCLKVCEAVKLISGKGKCVLYPRYLEFDTLNYRMKIGNYYSPFNPYNIKKLLKVIAKKFGKSSTSVK